MICRPRRLKVTAELTAGVAVLLKDRYFLPLKGLALDRGQGKDMWTGAILIGGDSFLNALTKPGKIQKVEHGPEQKSGRMESWREDTGLTKASTGLTEPYQMFLCNH